MLRRRRIFGTHAPELVSHGAWSHVPSTRDLARGGPSPCPVHLQKNLIPGIWGRVVRTRLGIFSESFGPARPALWRTHPEGHNASVTLAETRQRVDTHAIHQSSAAILTWLCCGHYNWPMSYGSRKKLLWDLIIKHSQPDVSHIGPVSACILIGQRQVVFGCGHRK
jgi:hypothetical protein